MCQRGLMLLISSLHGKSYSRLLLTKHEALTETGAQPAFTGNVQKVSESTMNHTFVQLYVITKTLDFYLFCSFSFEDVKMILLDSAFKSNGFKSSLLNKK